MAATSQDRRFLKSPEAKDGLPIRFCFWLIFSFSLTFLIQMLFFFLNEHKVRQVMYKLFLCSGNIKCIVIMPLNQSESADLLI